MSFEQVDLQGLVSSGPSGLCAPSASFPQGFEGDLLFRAEYSSVPLCIMSLCPHLQQEAASLMVTEQGTNGYAMSNRIIRSHFLATCFLVLLLVFCCSLVVIAAAQNHSIWCYYRSLAYLHSSSWLPKQCAL